MHGVTQEDSGRAKLGANGVSVFVRCTRYAALQQAHSAVLCPAVLGLMLACLVFVGTYKASLLQQGDYWQLVLVITVRAYLCRDCSECSEPITALFLTFKMLLWNF